MNTVKERIRTACTTKNISLSKMLRKAEINGCDYYSAVNGKKTFFPAWRKRISATLVMTEEELFPEYKEVK